jgi:hypothetical protein
MTKRIVGLVVAAVLVLGLGGAALAAASPERPSYGVEEALALAADPAPPPQPGAGAGAKKQELQDCVKPKVDAGADRRTALTECAAQLGIPVPAARPGRAGKGPRPGKGGGLPAAGRAAHAELVVPKQGAPDQWETVVVDRGKVTTASADSISVQRPDGPTVTIKVGAGTKVRGAASAGELAPGREVVVVSAGGEARSIVARR